MKVLPPYRSAALWLIFGLLVVRIVTLLLSPYGLHGDEAQYWAWAQDLDWGYFSKPPMIAWIIAATTAIFGDAEWAVRLASPVLHSATAYLIFLSGQKAFSARAGFWASAIYMLMPAVWVSSMIISTDAALLFFWALALHGWVSIRQNPSWRWAIQIGVAIGLGVTSKYAMLFFIPPLILACMFDRSTRTALVNIKGVIAALLAAVIIAPNIWWNKAHNFATITHTAANTSLNDKVSYIHPLELLKFLVDQFGVFGPIPFVLLIIALIGGLKMPLKHRSSVPADNTKPIQFYLLLFTLTPLVIISIQAFLSRANANWAVSAYPSAALLLAGTIAQMSPKARWLTRGLWMQTIFCSALLIIALSPTLVNRIGLANSVKRLRAWPQTATLIEERVLNGHEGQSFEAIVFDHRLTFYDMTYYGLPETAPIFMWKNHETPRNHAELTQPFTSQGPSPVLIINRPQNDPSHLRDNFERLVPLPEITVDIGGGKTRKFMAWAAYEYSPNRQN